MNQLERKISLYGLTMIAAGSCIGSGIFRSPSETAAYLTSDLWVLVAWTVGGLIALAGALSLAELGSIFPHAGGVYVFIRKVYGDTAAFLYGWASLTVIISGSLAALSIVFASYLGRVFQMGPQTQLFCSMFTIAALSVMNIFGVNLGNAVSSTVTTLKLAGIVLVILVGLTMGHESLDWHASYQPIVHPQMSLFSAFGMACIGIFFSYGGFQHASFLAGEVKNPARNLPLAMIMGTLLVVAIYLTINIAYLRLLPVESIAATDQVAGTAISTVWSQGSVFISLLISVSVLGTISIYCMSAPRIYFALAADGLFFKSLAKVHPRFHTPANAILIQGVIACLILLVWSTFEDVINYTIFVDYFFLALAVFGVILLRIREPQLQRPYRAWGYPILPLVFTLFTGYVLLVTIMEKPMTALAGTTCLGLGWIVYWLYQRRNPATNNTSVNPHESH